MTRWPVRPHTPRYGNPGKRQLETGEAHMNATTPSNVTVDAFASVEMPGKF